MAESSNGNARSSFSSSPITNLSEDHLITILLLLPIDAILSFSTTCKRFRSLTSSDGLWEALCRREWGPTSLDALKSCRDLPRLPWVKIFEAVHKVDSISCHKLSNPDVELELPRPRASHSLNFLSDRLVLFGGGCEGGRHLDDTWVANIGKTQNQKVLEWKKVESGVPSGRFGHTCVVVGNHLVLFGGINDRGDRHNDTWIGDVVSDDKLGWRLLDVVGGSPAPPPRGAHASCCLGDKKVVIHGGIGLQGIRLSDTWILELFGDDEDTFSGTWHEVAFLPFPPPRSGHTLTCIRQNQAVLFGGRGLGYDVLNDVWLFDIQEENHERWINIFCDFENVPGRNSLPRVGHSATLVLGGRLLIYGGEDSNRRWKDDFWVLDVNAIPIRGLERICLNRSSAWKRFNGIGYKPKSRSFHRACADCSGRYVYVFGGMVDCLVQPPALSGLGFDGESLMIELLLEL